MLTLILLIGGTVAAVIMLTIIVGCILASSAYERELEKSTVEREIKATKRAELNL